jgi:hypothetical protein
LTSIERTAYPQFRRLTTARVLHMFFTPTEDEAAWARERTESPESRGQARVAHPVLVTVSTLASPRVGEYLTSSRASRVGLFVEGSGTEPRPVPRSVRPAR